MNPLAAVYNLFDASYNPWYAPGPAERAIADRMAFQASLSSAAARNTENAVDSLNTQDAWAQVLSDVTGRMGALAVGSNNGILTSTDRGALQAEFGQLQNFAASVTSHYNALAKYNGTNLFSPGGFDFYV